MSESSGPAAGEELIGQVSTLAMSGGYVAVGDLAGRLLRARWPDGAGAVLVSAHGDRGPIAAAGDGFATAGGWDPTVRRWDHTGQQPRWTSRPADGRVTAICVVPPDGRYAERVLAAGADRVVRPATAAGEDRVDLGPSRVLAMDGEDGTTTELLTGHGEISALVAGDDWWAAVDSGRVRVVVAGDEVDVSLPDGRILAITGSGGSLVVATDSAVWRYDVHAERAARVAERDQDDLQLLALACVDDIVIASTSEGLVRFPGGDVFGVSRAMGLLGSGPGPLERAQGRPHDGRVQAVDLVATDRGVAVLWPDGRVDERSSDGVVLAVWALRTG